MNTLTLRQAHRLRRTALGRKGDCRPGPVDGAIFAPVRGWVMSPDERTRGMGQVNELGRVFSGGDAT